MPKGLTGGGPGRMVARSGGRGSDWTVAGMFLGEHRHALDLKGRVILPAEFRDQLRGGAVMTGERDGCLAVWPAEAFDERAQEMRAKLRGSGTERSVARAFFSNASRRDPDRQGRMAIPQTLRDFAALQREVVVTGVFDHIEVWDAGAWERQRSAGERELAEGDSG